MGKYLEDARGFLAQAEVELERGRQQDNPLLFRDAAEKAWAAVVQATNGLMENRGERVPEGHSPRRIFLTNLERREHSARRLRLRNRYDKFYASLHSQCFYEGHCFTEILEEDFKDVAGFLQDIGSLANRTGKGTRAGKKD